jgi:hypothetical protein
MTRIIGLGLLLVGMASFALAGIPSPEIDAHSAASAVALLGGGLLVLRARRKR